MRLTSRFIFISLHLIITCNISKAGNYYLSANGSDLNKGNTAAASWKSIDRLNQQKLKAGDSVLFNRGDIFIGEIRVGFSGANGKPIVYGAFGSGENPVITGAIRINNWETIKPGLIAASLPTKVYSLFYDNKEQILARYPNKGYLVIDGGTNSKLAIYDLELIQADNYWNGTNIRFKSSDWEWRTSKVSEFSNHLVTLTDSSSSLLKAGWGYYFDNKLEELDTLNEWYYCDKEQRLFFMPESKDTQTHFIDAGIYENGFTILKTVSNVEIRDLSVKMFHNTAIRAEGNNENIRICGNEISNISQTGISVGLGSKACTIENNLVRDINGKGIFALEPEYMKISKNHVSRIGFMPGYGISGVNGMVGIGIGNFEGIKTSNSKIALNNLISYNKVDSIGYVGIRMDGANSILEYNEVNHVMLFLSDGAAIYCWAKSNYYTHDNIIRNNIIHDVQGNKEATPSPESIIANGIYIDNLCFQISVYGNVVFNLTGSGIHVNSDAYDNTVINNTIYNCGTGLSIAEWSKPNSTFGNTISGNVVFCKTSDQSAVELMNWLLPYTHTLGTLSKNTYYNFFEKYFFKESYLSKDKEEKISIRYTFESWQDKLGYDKDGSAYQLTSELAGFSNSSICVNNTAGEKKYSFDINDVFDLSGNKIDSLVLKPFCSQILLSR